MQFQREFGFLGEIEPEVGKDSLLRRFIVPPFSVLDARQGYWQERKSQWLELGIRSELGRGDNMLDMSATSAIAMGIITEEERDEWNANRRKKNLSLAAPGNKGNPPGGAYFGKCLTWVAGDRPEQELDDTLKRIPDSGRKPPSGYARTLSTDIMKSEWNKVDKSLGAYLAPKGVIARGKANPDIGQDNDGSCHGITGTSIFDPVLCELMYSWFCPHNGIVLDPFAGGSVRGIVASYMGLKYIGVDLSEQQLAANREQAAAIVPNNVPVWLSGDSRLVVPQLDMDFDLIFSCPPYYNLEVYSYDECDLSAMGWDEFVAAYREIIGRCTEQLRDNRFAVFVVGDIRDESGFYRNLTGLTISAFGDSGASLYNDAVLITAVGSLPIRVGQQFGTYRKMGKGHQNVLVFYKGDPKRIPDVLEAEIH